MGLFGSSSPFDADIEKATNENNTTDQWGLILEICDRVAGSSTNAKECLRSVLRRLGHTDPHVVIQAITLLDACVSNCGKTFHLEVASREFENEFRRLLGKQRPPVAQKMAGLIKKWAEGEFKDDPQLNLIPALYQKLQADGEKFSEPTSSSGKTSAAKAQAEVSNDPNVVSSQQEMDDIAKAIELSLKESPMKHATSYTSSRTTNNNNTTSTSSSSLYPSTSQLSFSATTPKTTAISAVEARKVRALYDFEAAEDNELNFMAGDIIHVTDDSDPNWWKGYNQRGDGLFPASFVTADLSVEPESLRLDLDSKSNKKFVQFADDVKEAAREEQQQQQTVEINEEKLDRLLYLLHEANPEDPSTDSREMLNLETVVNQMGPLIDQELERVDMAHAQLARVSVGLVDAFNLYHALMRESEKMPMQQYMAYGQQQPMYGHHMQQQQPPPPSMMMNPGMFPPQQQQQQQQPQHGPPQPGMPPYVQGPQFPVGGPSMVGGNVSSQAASMQMGPQQQQQQQPPQMVMAMNNHPAAASMGMGTPPHHQMHHHNQSQQPQSQQQPQPAPAHQMVNGQATPVNSPQQMTMTSSSGAPISNTGIPNTFVQNPQQVVGGFPPGPQMNQQRPPAFSVGGGGPAMQFQGIPSTVGGSPQHVPGQANVTAGQPPHHGPPAPAMGGIPGHMGMGSFNHHHHAMMGPQPSGPQMLHPGPPMSMGGGDVNIPVYQQQR